MRPFWSQPQVIPCASHIRRPRDVIEDDHRAISQGGHYAVGVMDRGDALVVPVDEGEVKTTRKAWQFVVQCVIEERVDYPDSG